MTDGTPTSNLAIADTMNRIRLAMAAQAANFRPELAAQISRFQSLGESLAEMIKNASSPSVAFRALQEAQWQQLGITNMAWMRRLHESLQQISDNIKSIKEVTLRFGPVMLELGWPPPLMFPGEMRQIVVMRDEQGVDAAREFADRVMVKRYDAEALGDITAEWESKSWLARRAPILKEAVSAYLEGRYLLAIPALMAQIEGMIADGFEHHGRMKQRDYEGYLSTLLDSESAFAFDKFIKEFTMTVVLADFEHGNTLISSLSRHAILHGADTAYGTPANALKVILLFDYLQAAFEEPAPELE